MTDEKDFISKLMEETIAENRESSQSELLCANDILSLQDSLFQAFPVNIYSKFMRISFKHGNPVDIPRGLRFFHNEDQVFEHWNQYETFEMNIIDPTFKEVISDFLFVEVDKAMLFFHDHNPHLIFYNSDYEEKVWSDIQRLNEVNIKKAA